MCTLHSSTANQDAIKAFFGATPDAAGNLQNMPSVLPDWEASIIQSVGDERELIRLRWGSPNPVQPPDTANDSDRGHIYYDSRDSKD